MSDDNDVGGGDDVDHIDRDVAAPSVTWSRSFDAGRARLPGWIDGRGRPRFAHGGDGEAGRHVRVRTGRLRDRVFTIVDVCRVDVAVGELRLLPAVRHF